MKRLLCHLIGLILIITVCFSCTEDSLTPNESDTDYFLEPYGVSEADAALQKEFYAQEKVYLLFNDTLKREYLGKQVSGMDEGRWDSYFVFRSRWDSKSGRKPLMSAAKSRTQFSYNIFCAWSSFRRRMFSNFSSEYSYIPYKANQYT